MVQACYDEIGCDATAFLCTKLNARSPPDAPCVADTTLSLSSIERGHFSEIARAKGCAMDSLAWLAGGDRNRIVTWVYTHCNQGGQFDAGDPKVQALSRALGYALKCGN